MRPAEELRYLVLAAQREGNRLLAAALRPLGLTPAWAEAIIILDEHSPLTVKQLGDLLVCEGDHPSRLVDRMARADLILRSTSSSDRRAVELRLSPRATALVPQVRAIEDGLYDVVEQLLEAPSIEATNTSLRSFVAELPAGKALEARKRHQTGLAITAHISAATNNADQEDG